jgi:hypothetical protein
MFSIRYLDNLAPFALIVLCVVSAIFLSPILILGVFGLTLALAIVLKYDSRIFVGTAIFMLILSAVFLASGNSAAADEITVIAYHFFVIGVLGLLIEYLKGGRETPNKNIGEETVEKPQPLHEQINADHPQHHVINGVYPQGET